MYAIIQGVNQSNDNDKPVIVPGVFRWTRNYRFNASPDQGKNISGHWQDRLKLFGYPSDKFPNANQVEYCYVDLSAHGKLATFVTCKDEWTKNEDEKLIDNSYSNALQLDQDGSVTPTKHVVISDFSRIDTTTSQFVDHVLGYHPLLSISVNRFGRLLIGDIAPESMVYISAVEAPIVYYYKKEHLGRGLELQLDIFSPDGSYERVLKDLQITENSIGISRTCHIKGTILPLLPQAYKFARIRFPMLLKRMEYSESIKIQKQREANYLDDEGTMANREVTESELTKWMTELGIKKEK